MKRPSVLRHLIRNLLKEAEDPIPDPDLEGEDSLDAQVDRYFVDFEAEAQNLKKEGTDFRMFMRRFLTEAEDDEEEAEDDEEEAEGDEDSAEEGGDDELSDMLGGEPEEEEAAPPAKLKTDDIDMTNFVAGVMRLVDNYDNLLEVRNAILRRAAKFIKEKYEPDALSLFKEELLESFGAEIGKSDKDMEDNLDVPGAARGSGPIEGGG